MILKKDAARDLPTIASTQYALEGQLGTKVQYDLELERLASEEKSFSLVMLNLPKELSFAFVDPASGSRITHLKFTEERSSQHLQLEISIPDKLDPKYVGSSIDFVVLVCQPQELVAIGESGSSTRKSRFRRKRSSSSRRAGCPSSWCQAGWASWTYSWPTSSRR